jgi:hypothetical protein
MTFCKNCGEKVVGNYCSHCGQKTVEKRISFHYIWHEALHFFTHFEKGFLFTSWSMLTKPGKVVTDFVKGKRKIYQRGDACRRKSYLRRKRRKYAADD